MHYAVVGYLRKYNELTEETRRKDPLKPFLRAAYMVSLGLLGDMDRVEEEYERGKAISGDQWIMGDYFIFLLRLGTKDDFSINDIPESLRSNQNITKLIESPEEGLAELRRLYNSDDNLSNIGLITDIASGAVYLDDPEFALDCIERSVSLETTGLTVHWLPLFHEVRQLQRYKVFVKEIGLVDYWKEYGWPDLCRPVGDGDFECD